MRRIWRHLPLEAKLKTFLYIGTGIAWSVYYVKMMNKVVEAVQPDAEFLKDYCEADVKATMAILNRMTDVEIAEEGMRALEGDFGLKRLWPDGPVFM